MYIYTYKYIHMLVIMWLSNTQKRTEKQKNNSEMVSTTVSTTCSTSAISPWCATLVMARHGYSGRTAEGRRLCSSPFNKRVQMGPGHEIANKNPMASDATNQQWFVCHILYITLHNTVHTPLQRNTRSPYIDPKVFATYCTQHCTFLKRWEIYLC